MSTTTIELLENWISDLEKQVYGLQKHTENQDSALENPVIDNLLHANTLISSALTGRENINTVITRLPELNSYLDPGYEISELPTNAKAQLLLTMEPEIRENYNLLSKVQELQPVLVTERLQEIPELTTKLNSLNLAYLKEYKDSEHLTTNMQEILSKYNSVITSISKSLIMLDAAVTAAEIAAMPKQQIDE